jgi:hypothetical protein
VPAGQPVKLGWTATGVGTVVVAMLVVGGAEVVVGLASDTAWTTD